MVLVPINVEPGLYTETTDRTNLNRWKDGLNVRFFKGLPEKIDGWTKILNTQFLGLCRSITAWTSLTFARYIGFGTHLKLYLTDTQNYYDITPLRASGNLPVNPFTTVNHSNVVAVHSPGHGFTAPGDFVHFANAAAFNGVNPNGQWTVNQVIDNNNFNFLYIGAAMGSGTGGGNAPVTYQYEIPIGLADSIVGTGWGTGTWGSGTWGTPRTLSSLQSARIWSLANWGEDLLASPIDCPIYVWVASLGTDMRATLITQAPPTNRRILVSGQARIAISFGSNDGMNPDPMLIRWSDSEDYTDWTPSPTNLAGDTQLDKGSQIITGVHTRNEIAVFTDTSLYRMYLTGDDLVFGFQDQGDVPRLVSPNAAVDIDGTIYAWCHGGFIKYDGQVSALPCDVYSRTVSNFTDMQAAKIYGARNKDKNEIIWFFPSEGSNEVDSCVGFNYVDGNWWLGNVVRTAWYDTTEYFDAPFGAGTNGYLYQHESGVDADGAPLSYFLKSFDLEVSAGDVALTRFRKGQEQAGPGEIVMKVNRTFIDTQRLAGTHQITLTGVKYPADVGTADQQVKGPFNFAPHQKRVDAHIRARQISLELSSSGLGADIRIGGFRFDARGMGSR